MRTGDLKILVDLAASGPPTEPGGPVERRILQASGPVSSRSTRNSRVEFVRRPDRLGPNPDNAILFSKAIGGTSLPANGNPRRQAAQTSNDDPENRYRAGSRMNSISQEDGMRFQGLAAALGTRWWPQLVAHQRKKDFGLDAYAPASQTPEGIGKGLAASITSTFKKISDDAKKAKENFSDLEALLFIHALQGGQCRQEAMARSNSEGLWDRTPYRRA